MTLAAKLNIIVRHRVAGIILLLLLAAFSSLPLTAANDFSRPANSSCACPNQNLTFQCIVDGGGATIWRGSAFSCSSNGNEIFLRHSTFAEGIEKECNNGAIIGESIAAENNRFTSRLNVTVSNVFNEKTVQCFKFVDSTAGMTEIGEVLITVMLAPISQVPDGVQLTALKPGELTFTWTIANSQCPSINYLASSNCSTWSCIVATDTTTATCSGLHLPSVCTFTVQTEVCGQMGPPSDPITVTLRAPGKPNISIIPLYSAETQHLLRIKAYVQQQASFNITDTVSSSVTLYNISYNFATTFSNLAFNRNTSCVEDVCECFINVPSDLCSSSTDISVILSASNALGQGPPSDPKTIDCTNQFVKVEYDKTTRTITCRFLDETDTSVKSCNVTYGQCDQEQVQTRRLGNFSTMTTPNLVYLKLSDCLECYNVTASSDVFTVVVEGSISGSGSGGLNVASIAVIIIIIILVVVLAVTSILVIAVFMIKRKRDKCQNKDYGTEIGLVDKHQRLPVKEDQIKVTEEVKVFTIKANAVIDVDGPEIVSSKVLNLNDYKKFKISRDSELREFLEEQNLRFKSGRIFYQFEHNFESISEDQDLLILETEFFEELIKIFFSPTHPLCGHRVPKPKGTDGKLFVRCTGSGARHLPAGSMLLYEVQSESTTSPSSKPVAPPLKPIISSHFEMTILTSKVTVEEFCEKKKIPNEYSVLLELSTFVKKPDYVDVVLFEKVTGFLYTGPTARSIVKEYYSSGVSPDLAKWRVFVLCQTYDMDLKPGTTILHQKQGDPTENFHMLTVNEDDGYMSMSDFVEKMLQLKEFTNGHAFYEFTREEDLHYYKDVVHLTSSDDNQRVIQSSIDLFYRLPGVPAFGVKPSIMSGGRVFIQSTSQGARCVKSGDTILYKV